MTEIIRCEYDGGQPHHHYARKSDGPLAGYDIYNDDHKYQLTVLGERLATSVLLALETAYLRGARAGVDEMTRRIAGGEWAKG